jgi:hypothetical protein
MIDVRIYLDRDGYAVATVEGRRVSIPRTTSASDALRMVASRLDALAWVHRCSTFDAGRRPA